MKKGFAVAIVLLSVLLVQLGISGLAAERAETISGVYQPVETEKAETIQEADLKRVKTVEMVPEEYRKFESVKKRAGESIVLGGGYTLEITSVDPEDDKVSMELKLDNTVIDSKALKIGSSYVYEGIVISEIVGISEVAGVAWTECSGIFEPSYLLSISSIPQGAIIFIDSKERGSTPQEIGPYTDLDEHTLHLKLEGYKDAIETFKYNFTSVMGGIVEKKIVLDEIERDVGGTGTTDAGTTDAGTTDAGTTDTGTTDAGTTDTGTMDTGTMDTGTTDTGTTDTGTTDTGTTDTGTTVPGFLAITFILAILCGYWILKKKA